MISTPARQLHPVCYVERWNYHMRGNKKGMIHVCFFYPKFGFDSNHRILPQPQTFQTSIVLVRPVGYTRPD